jgi:hypothetical protein
MLRLPFIDAEHRETAEIHLELLSMHVEHMLATERHPTEIRILRDRLVTIAQIKRDLCGSRPRHQYDVIHRP